MTSGPAPPYLRAHHTPPQEERTEIMASAFTLSYPSFLFQVEYQALCYLRYAYLLLRALAASSAQASSFYRHR